jgi:hypothetical protein
LAGPRRRNGLHEHGEDRGCNSGRYWSAWPNQQCLISADIENPSLRRTRLPVLVEQIPAGVQARLRLKTTSFVSASPRAWHGLRDLSSAFLAAVRYAVGLATRNEDAHFHKRAASGALRHIALKARLGFCTGVTLRLLSLQALKPFRVSRDFGSTSAPSKSTVPALARQSRCQRAAAVRSLLPTLAGSGKAVHLSSPSPGQDRERMWRGWRGSRLSGLCDRGRLNCTGRDDGRAHSPHHETVSQQEITSLGLPAAVIQTASNGACNDANGGLRCYSSKKRRA